MLLALPASCAEIPGFPWHLDKPQLIFVNPLETLSQVKINPVLVLSLTLCHEVQPCVYSLQKGLRSSFRFISDILSPVWDTIPEVTCELSTPALSPLAPHLLNFNLLTVQSSNTWMWLSWLSQNLNSHFCPLPEASSYTGTG